MDSWVEIAIAGVMTVVLAVIAGLLNLSMEALMLFYVILILIKLDSIRREKT